MIVGVDEAGRGPLAGCVVACALYIKDKRKIINPELPKISSDYGYFRGSGKLIVKDSKKLSPLQREITFEQFRENTVFSVGLATPKEIDRLNILKATFVAFERAIAGLLKSYPRLKRADFIIDGNRFSTNIPIKYQCVVKADESVLEAAFASIVAKLFRDYLMGVADMCFPEWDFMKHKGYPTQEHIDIIEKYSLCPLHRRSFAPCHPEKGHTTNQRR
ncbi:MAG: ribonuclease HII [Candidatus Omnitrophica bacterium 4484_171]|nr:MAG: ribonuclease HII [Candidatus Omnitrophica bacterium 4484_171]